MWSSLAHSTCLITAGSLPLSLLAVLDVHLDLIISAEKLVWGRERLSWTLTLTSFISTKKLVWGREQEVEVGGPQQRGS